MKKVTFLGRCNDINFQAEYEFEFAENEEINTIAVIENMTKKMKLAGVQPPVGKSEKSYVEKQTNATGTHPQDLIPAIIPSTGIQYKCKDCGAGCYVVRGKSKSTGRAWAKVFCNLCDFYKFDDKFLIS